MERLLTDGGDLDSMDRSLLDYNGINNGVNCSKPGNGTVTSPMSDLNVSLIGNGNGSANGAGGMNGSTTNGVVTPTVTPTLTSPTSYKSSENGPPAPALSPTAVTTQMMNKRDIVVRFTEDRNSVQNVKMTLSASQQQQQHNSSSNASASKSSHAMPPPEAYRCVEDLLDQTDCGRGRRPIARLGKKNLFAESKKASRVACVMCRQINWFRSSFVIANYPLERAV